MAQTSGVLRLAPSGLGLAVVTCGLLAACGDGSSPPSGTPAAETTPTPGPSPVPVSFLHVRHEGGDIDTYQIDGTSGRLRLAGSQRLGDVHALAGDPEGRYVFMAYGPRTESSHPKADASIASYAASPSGSLVLVSEAWSRPWETEGARDDCGNRGWRWLAASRDRVFGSWVSGYGGGCQHLDYIAVTHPVTPGGHVEPDFASGSWTDSLGGMALDPGANALYVSREPPLHGPAPLTAHVVRSDGRLAITGYTDLCVASPVVIPIAPLLAVRGFVFGAAYLDKDTVCSWEGPRLAPRANLGLAASLGAAFSPVDETMAALLALAGDVRTRRGTYLRTDLRLLSMENGGGVALLATLELPSRVRQVLFHPSGRFLYAADEDATLWTYSIGSGGRLEPIARLPDAAHASDPDSDIHTPPPFMAVCVRAGTSP
jgi:hypothetical protein